MLKERSEDNINTVTRVIWKFSARETLYCLEKFRGKYLKWEERRNMLVYVVVAAASSAVPN